MESSWGVIFINYVADDRHIHVSRGLAQKNRLFFSSPSRGRRSQYVRSHMFVLLGPQSWVKRRDSSKTSWSR